MAMTTKNNDEQHAPEAGGLTWAEAAKLRADMETARGDVLRLERRVGEQAAILTREHVAAFDLLEERDAATERAEKAEAEVGRLTSVCGAQVEQHTRDLAAAWDRADAAERTVAALVDGIGGVLKRVGVVGGYVGQDGQCAKTLRALLADHVAAGARELWVPRSEIEGLITSAVDAMSKRLSTSAKTRIAVLESAIGEAAAVFESYAKSHDITARGAGGDEQRRNTAIAIAEANRARAAKLRALLAKEQPADGPTGDGDGAARSAKDPKTPGRVRFWAHIDFEEVVDVDDVNDEAAIDALMQDMLGSGDSGWNPTDDGEASE
jgi:hypothetical protein